MLLNMIRNAKLFGSNQMLDRSIYIDVLRCLKEQSLHHMDTILQVGEISDRFYFVTQGQVGIFLSLCNDFCEILDEESADSDVSMKASQGSQQLITKRRNIHFGTLNIGSNFNHFNALLSQQSLFIFKAFGSNTQVSSLTKEQYD